MPESGTASGGARLRDAKRDAGFLLISGVHALILLQAPPAWVIGLLFWWHANTVSHHFIHRPFFTGRAANRAFSAWTSLVLGVPQRLWRDLHLAHHAGRPFRLAPGRQLGFELGLVCLLYAVIWYAVGGRLFTWYWPGLWFGCFLCWLQGHYEHAGGTRSYYGRLYNLIFFKDGYHVEHHARPGAPWYALRRDPSAADRTSRWPAVLRWLERTEPEPGTRRPRRLRRGLCPGPRLR